MISVLREHILSRVGYNTDGLETVLSHFQVETVQKNELLQQEGSVCKFVYFVASGCLQHFIYTPDAEEVTNDILIEHSWYADLQSFSEQSITKENIRALEETAVCKITAEHFQKMIVTIPQFPIVYSKILEELVVQSKYRVENFLSLDAKDRLLWLHKHRPEIIKRVSNKVLASYLGIREETLSRLKHKIS
jgi:CRP-like cAMP-binding protein